ncbi:MAG: DUF721 domain-containing protein [Myxococcaceae bacterium]|nr:DUF721 domain-containing protein [Myxococcaceae bacterium]
MNRAAIDVVNTTGSTAALTPVWNEVVGPAIANNSRPKALYGVVLVVEVDSAQWADALQKAEAQIVSRLNGVKQLRLEVRK